MQCRKERYAWSNKGVHVNSNISLSLTEKDEYAVKLEKNTI